jgi:hypothetical protein
MRTIPLAQPIVRRGRADSTTTSLTSGTFPRAITTSSPSTASWMRRDR